MPQTRLLVVDDEPFNLEILCGCFDGLDYTIDTATDGESAWRQLTSGTAYDLVILDRMMPILDGIALLKRIKSDAALAGLPVIMQTAAGRPDAVREGLAAGAYYYLVKPYERESLLSIVRSALADANARVVLQQQLAAHCDALQLMATAEFSLRSLAEAGQLAAFLAHACPDPQSAVLGLSELLINAVEHGNLGITYAGKAELKRCERWEEEIDARLALPENSDKRVRVTFFRQPATVAVRIRDDGGGFAWQEYLDFSPERAFDPNGRGIALARHTSFASIEYEGTGNSVFVTLKCTEAMA